jgi:hypothetical protein
MSLCTDVAASLPFENDVSIHKSSFTAQAELIVRFSQSRHEMIDLLLNNPGWFFDLLDELPNFSDLDRLLVRENALSHLIIVERVTGAFSIGPACSCSQSDHTEGFPSRHRKHHRFEASTRIPACTCPMSWINGSNRTQ